MSFIKYQWPSILWAAIVFYLCTFYSGSTGGVRVPYLDKVAHFCFYLGFTPMVTIGLMLQHKTSSPLRLPFFISLFMGGSIEILQAYVFTWRSASWGDMAANTLGAVLGLWLSPVAYRCLQYLFFSKNR